MSFDSRFEKRWTEVIKPGIGNITANDVPMEAVRVDTRKVSDSILTEILSGIATARVVFADITTLHSLDGRAMRNGNVLYEVGMAHATRLPEEVLLFRSDKDSLLFDTANVRVNTYDPDGQPDEARKLVAASVFSALKEVDLRKNLAVKKAASGLSLPAWTLLADMHGDKPVHHPPMQTFGQTLGNRAREDAISALLSSGAIRTVYLRITPENLGKLSDADQILSYECTEFGRALFREVTMQQGFDNPELLKLLETRYQQSLAAGKDGNNG